MVDLRIKIIFCNTFITANKPLVVIIIKSVQGVTEVNLRATKVSGRMLVRTYYCTVLYCTGSLFRSRRSPCSTAVRRRISMGSCVWSYLVSSVAKSQTYRRGVAKHLFSSPCPPPVDCTAHTYVCFIAPSISADDSAYCPARSFWVLAGIF